MKNIVQTRGRHTSEWGKKGYETSVIGRQEREKSTKYEGHSVIFVPDGFLRIDV